MFTRFAFHHNDPDSPRHCGPHGRHHARFGGQRGSPWERGFGGGSERFLDPGDLQLIILQLLSEKPSYGYELIKTIEERLSGGYAPSPGVVYPTLTLLEERGLAEVQTSEGNRKVYAITEAGKAELAANQSRTSAIFDRMEHSGRRFGRERSPEIMRAFRNLGEAIRGRMMRGGNLTPEQITHIANAINDAAHAIDGI